jgi:type I restriction enzyme, S subunit
VSADTSIPLSTGLKPYPEYKESGQAWVDNVPKHWKVLPNRALFAEVKERNHPEEEMLSVTITKGIIRQKALLDGSSKKDSSRNDKSAYKMVCPDDLAYNKMRAWQGAIGVSAFRGIVSPAYVVMRMREDHNPRYFHHLYRTPHFAKEAERWSYGITSDMWSLRPEHFKMIYSPLPPPDEQSAIVRFLDYSNRRIERAIRAKKKLIALLTEQKQAIIHRAVTRGLDPTIPLKSSGIPWLGDIPKHWELRPLKQLLLQMDYGTSENVRGKGKIRVLTMGHIQDGKVLIPERGGLDAVPPGLLLETKDLLFNRTNSPDLVGKVGLFTGEASNQVTFASYLVRLRVHPEHSPFWLNYLLNSPRFWAYARSQALVSLHQANLNSTRYGQILLPVPPKPEQDKIVESIIAQAGGIERAIQRTEREIALLREYRTRLIADVVTGKLDVREAAKNLPDEEEEKETVPVESEEAETEGTADMEEVEE